MILVPSYLVVATLLSMYFAVLPSNALGYLTMWVPWLPALAYIVYAIRLKRAKIRAEEERAEKLSRRAV